MHTILIKLNKDKNKILKDTKDFFLKLKKKIFQKDIWLN